MPPFPSAHAALAQGPVAQQTSSTGTVALMGKTVCLLPGLPMHGWAVPCLRVASIVDRPSQEGCLRLLDTVAVGLRLVVGFRVSKDTVRVGYLRRP